MMLKMASWSLIIFLGLLTISCAALRFSQAQQWVEIRENIPYLENSKNPRQQLDLYLPRDTTNFPMVVFVHGGYWHSQDKQYYQAFTGLYGNVGVELAKYGIGVASINYRLLPEAKIEEQIQDVAAAIGWVEKHIQNEGGDPKRLYLSGHSAGGHLVALLGQNPEWLSTKIWGIITLSAIFDLEHMELKQPPDFNRDVTYPVFGRTPDRLKHYSPQTYFGKQRVPFLILNGEKDYPYLVEQTEVAVKKLQNLKMEVTHYVIPDHSHADMVLNIGKEKNKIGRYMANFILRTNADIL